ncbi:MAG: tRNA (adenosine(37)-N6)-threonylcarbamoyltransferase complex dimerization subunit type 1 TsaB, partial [Gammaproteobacteria bacterium]
MKILAIETATEACSAALAIDDSQIERYEVAPRKHTQLILPMVEELMNEADIKVSDLDAIAFGQGPGAFTGVRIAMGVIQGLAFAQDTPVIPVSTLAALAQHVANDHQYVASAIDARMQEIYWGLFKKNDSGVMQAISEEVVCAAKDVDFISDEIWFGAGSGWDTYSDVLSSKFDNNLSGFDGQLFPSAVDVLALAKPAYMENKMISVEQASPV